jgi:hypothetical protein
MSVKVQSGAVLPSGNCALALFIKNIDKIVMNDNTHNILNI